jgi:antitoxin component of MazEF toxin-antitoxin module
VDIEINSKNNMGKINKKEVRKITKLGGHSLGVTIPIEIVRELKWRERQKVVVKKSGKKIIIQDWGNK